MAKDKKIITKPEQREIEPQEFYLMSIANLTNKMLPADYLYLSDKIIDISNRLEQIKKR